MPVAVVAARQRDVPLGSCQQLHRKFSGLWQHPPWLVVAAVATTGLSGVIATPASGDCDALADLEARLNPGFWAAAFVFRSLRVRPDQLLPPNKTRQAGASTVSFEGWCEASNFPASLFTWQKPTSDGGDWIAMTSKPKLLDMMANGYLCPLTGIAVTTASDSAPSFRLQFEECPRKTAVEVPLKKELGPNGTRLVNWMCQVASGSKLCERANSMLPSSSQTTRGPQPFLDLRPLATALSHGITRMQVHNKCFEELDWYISDTALGIDANEFGMLEAIRKLLAPSSCNDGRSCLTAKIPADIMLETVCVADCNGAMNPKCTAHAPRPPLNTVPPPQQTHWHKTHAKAVASFGEFMEIADRPKVLPWLAYAYISLFLLGSALACCCPLACHSGEVSPERKIKKVSVVYHEVPEESFFSNFRP